MRIAKRSKKALSPYPKVNALILAIQDAADDELPAILNSVQYWHWPRTDLHYWIKPLNRFDNILEDVCKSYNIGNGDNIQVNVFTPRTKELVLAILRYTRLLLENATNRKLYASFDRMNDLLLTRDLDVLESVLRLIFRRAQQIASNGQMHQAGTFNLTSDRVRDLTKGWKAVQQSPAGLTMFDLVKNDYSSVVINSDLEEVSFQFYRKAASPGSLAKELPESSGEGIAMTPLATPAPKSSTSRSSRPTTSTAMTNPPMTPSGGKAQQQAETELR